MQLGNTHLLGGIDYDSNLYLVDEELLVDCGTGFLFDETVEQFKRFQLKPSKIKLIVCTHSHFDHLGGAAKFKELSGAKLGMHPEAVKVASDPDQNLASQFGVDFRSPGADKILEEGSDVKVCDNKFKVLHTPGHSKGSICLYDPEKKVLISGDLLFADGFGRTDLKGGNKQQLRKSLLKIKELSVDILLPGHGNPVSEENPYAKGKLKEIFSKIDSEIQ